MRKGHTKVTDAFFYGITCVLKTLVDPAEHQKVLFISKSSIYVEKLSYLLGTIITYLLLFNIYYTIILYLFSIVLFISSVDIFTLICHT